MEENSIKRNNIDWDSFKKRYRSDAKDVKKTSELYPFIRKALRELGDNHSFLMTPERIEHTYSSKKSFNPIVSELINDKIAYLKIPSFSGNDSLAMAFSNEIQSKIKSLDKQDIKGWIIDLTSNGGGNMWPMYLGLSPILGEGISGYFADIDNNLIPWKYSDNAVLVGENKMFEKQENYRIKSIIPKVAVLISDRTASSGEAVALMFKGMERTKIFGEDTAGLTTGNAMFGLKDGAILVLTTVIYADRSRKVYGTKIEPDIYSFSPRKEAIKWINK